MLCVCAWSSLIVCTGVIVDTVDQVDKATVKLSKVLAPQVKKVVSQGRTKEFEDLAVIAAQGLKGDLLYI